MHDDRLAPLGALLLNVSLNKSLLNVAIVFDGLPSPCKTLSTCPRGKTRGHSLQWPSKPQLNAFVLLQAYKQTCPFDPSLVALGAFLQLGR